MIEKIVTPKNPSAFRAIQFKNEDAEDIHRELSRCVERNGENDYEIYTMFGNKKLAEGDWIIAANDTDIFVVTDEEFKTDWIQVATRVPVEGSTNKKAEIVPIKGHGKN